MVQQVFKDHKDRKENKEYNGIQGIQGVKGDTGDTGVGISNITKTGTSGLIDTYTITFTNGNTTTFEVSNGRGIVSIAKTATQGLVDTYTITYNDSTTSTFTVTNGKDENELSDRLLKQYEAKSLSGENIYISDSADLPLSDFGLKGRSIQDGTPTPANEVPIQSVGDNVNLSDIVLNSSITSTIIYKTYTLKPNTDYTISSNTYLSSIATANVFAAAGTSFTPSSPNNGVVNNRTITSDSNGKITIGYRNYNNALDYSSGNYFIKLEEGLIATPYSPYGMGCASIVKTNEDSTLSKTYIVPTQSPMRSIGDMRDDFIKQNGIWYERHKIASLVFNGSENWQEHPNGTNSYELSNAIRISFKEDVVQIISNYFKGVKYEDRTLAENNLIYPIYNNIFVIRNTSFEDVASFKTWLSTHNTEVIYVLAEPVLIPCTAEQSSQLDEIIEDGTYKDITHYYSTDAIEPTLDLTYYQDWRATVNSYIDSSITQAIGGAY